MLKHRLSRQRYLQPANVLITSRSNVIFSILLIYLYGHENLFEHNHSFPACVCGELVCVEITPQTRTENIILMEVVNMKAPKRPRNPPLATPSLKIGDGSPYEARCYFQLCFVYFYFSADGFSRFFIVFLEKAFASSDPASQIAAIARTNGTLFTLIRK